MYIQQGYCASLAAQGVLATLLQYAKASGLVFSSGDVLLQWSIAPLVRVQGCTRILGFRGDDVGVEAKRVWFPGNFSNLLRGAYYVLATTPP